MAANPLPNKYELLVAAAEDAADGAAAHGETIGLVHNNEAAIRGDLATLQSAQQVFQTTRQTSVTLTKAQETADANGTEFIAAAKNVLSPLLGGQWSTVWVPTGFLTSLAIPGKLPARQTLLGELRDYLTANPGHENAGLNVTAAQAAAVHTALSDARTAVNAGLVARGDKRKARDAAQKAMKKRLSGLIGELKQLLSGNDPRWRAFGFNEPESDVTPAAPTALVLTAGGPGEVLVDWDDVPSADHYRVFKQIADVDASFVAVGSPTDSDFLIAGVTNGQTLRVKVSAVTGSLEGPASGVVEITLSGGATFRYEWILSAEGDLVFWFEMPEGLSGVTNILLREEGQEFTTVVNLQPGQSQQLTWPQAPVVGELDEVYLRDAENNNLASGVRDPELPDPGP